MSLLRPVEAEEAQDGGRKHLLRRWCGDWHRSFVLHVLTGFLVVGAHYSVMWLLVAAGMDGVAASAIGFLGGAATRFAMSYRIFSPDHGVPVALWRFAIALGLQWAANVALLEGFLLAGLGLWIAQVSVTVLLTFLNFLAYRVWVFRSTRHSARRT
jgi:putative flippase GtrA